MNILEMIRNCTDEELNVVIDNILNQLNSNAEQNKKLGFADNTTSLSRIEAHKGFISPTSTIRFSSNSVNHYNMSTKDYFYEFAKYIRNKNIQNMNAVIKEIQTYIIYYFGINDAIDRRDGFLIDKSYLNTTTDEEMWAAIENFNIGDFKKQNIAQCTERSALAQNLLSLFGIESYYCYGCLNNNGKIEPHCFNIAKAKDSYMILDYSVPVPVVKNGKVYDQAPFQEKIELDEIDDVLNNSSIREFVDYEYLNSDGKIIKVPVNATRTYVVSETSFENAKTRK